MHRRKKADYGRLRTKVLLQTMAMAFGAVFLILAIYLFVWSGRGADITVWLIQTLFGSGRSSALAIYQGVFRNNAEIIMGVAILVVFFVMLRFFLSWFTKYFSEVERGIEALMKEDGGEIELPQELNAIENNLNTVRQNLEKRALETKLAEQRKNDLVMYLAHDLKTPLTSVIGYLSLMDEVPDMPAEQKARYTHIALEKAARLEILIDQFFEISRYNLSEMVLETGRVDLKYLLIQLADEFYPALAAQEKSVALEAPDDLWLEADAEKLARVFGNLLRNAAAYSEAGGVISIRAARDEGAGTATVSVINTGKTIPAHKLEAVFDKFYRLDEARGSGQGGSGLGLAISREIIGLHGGSITAQSESGTTVFTVVLPVHAPFAGGAGAPLPAGALPGAGALHQITSAP